MCANCVAGATVAAAGASGARAWLAAKAYAWVTPRRLHLVTWVLAVVAVAAASVGIGGAA